MKDKFEELEEKLNIATDLIAELNIDAVEPPEIQAALAEPITAELVPVDNEKEEVFSLAVLKSDFLLIRQNVMKLVSTGQRIMDSVSVLDVSDMKAAQLSAISSLQKTLGDNLQLMISIYREICEIERLRLGLSGTPQEGGVQQIATGNTVNNTTNNIVFTGDTSQLLDIIKEHSG